MDYELSKGILKLYFDELISELSAESVKRIAEKIAAKIRVYEICHESHINKKMRIQELEMRADIANRMGRLGTALQFQNEAEEIIFSL